MDSAEDRRRRRDDREAASPLAKYLAELKRYPRLGEKEEERLRRDLIAGRPGAVDRLAHSALGFVVRIAAEYAGHGVSIEDLVNEGNVGLIEAARRYDPHRETKFITYAVWWIRKAMLSALARTAPVSVPSYHWQRLRRIRKAEAYLERALGRRPTRDEISSHLKEGLDSVERTLRLKPQWLSIFDPLHDEDGPTLATTLPDPKQRTPEERMLRREQEDLLVDAFGALTERERFVIVHRFGLLGRQAKTLRELGRRMGLSRERVRQIEAGAQKRLARTLERRRTLRNPAD